MFYHQYGEIQGLSRTTLAALGTWEKIAKTERYLDRRVRDLEKLVPHIPDEDMERYIQLSTRIVGG